MPAFRRACGLLCILALTLASLGAALHASSMAGMGAASIISSEVAEGSMPDCHDCEGLAKMATCTQTACSVFAAVLPHEDGLGGQPSASYVGAPDPVRVGLPRFTDPPPPRTLFLH